LQALSPAATMRRGYSIVQRADGGVVRAAAEVTAGERLTVRFAADRLTVTADRADGQHAGGTQAGGTQAGGTQAGGTQAGGKQAGRGRTGGRAASGHARQSDPAG
ncbi:MAG TPA: exodeoxyribonuclease VII large subunit, partial [Streptosporangiaceae bacterium]